MSLRFAIFCLLSAGLFNVPLANAWQLGTNTIFTTDVTVNEGYEDNLYLQDVAPNPAVPNAVPAREGSYFTAIIPAVGLAYHPASGLTADVSYAPEIALYNGEHNEDYTTHRLKVSLGDKSENMQWQQANQLTYIDGNRVGPTFGQTEGVPIMGGLSIRDRHAALDYLGRLNLTYTLGKWFLRPVANAYVHDFFTEQHVNPVNSGGVRIGTYENYVDRWELGGGLDAGREIFSETRLYVGYRYGHQEQGSLLGVTGRFSNNYQRFLLGLEGNPASWLRLDVSAGPDLRQWLEGTPIGFDRNKVLCYIDAKAALLPGPFDTVTLAMTRFLQPGFTSENIYEDIRYAVNWEHKFGKKFTVSPGFVLWIGNWRQPVDRKDWIYTPSLTVNYQFNQHLALEASYSYNWGQSHDPNLDDVEYRDNVGWIGLKFSF